MTPPLALGRVVTRWQRTQSSMSLALPAEKDQETRQDGTLKLPRRVSRQSWARERLGTGQL